MTDLVGKIIEVSSYYGIIGFIEKRNCGEEVVEIERKLPFFVKEPIRFSLGDEVEFQFIAVNEEGNSEMIRSQEIQYATNVKLVKASNTVTDLSQTTTPLIDSLNSKVLLNPPISDEASLLKFLKENNFRYSTLNELSVIIELVQGEISINDLKLILDYDVHFKEFLMKWILKIENEIKNRIENTFEKSNLTIETILDKIDNHNYPKLNQLKKRTLKKIKKNYLLRDGDWRLNFVVEQEDKIPKLMYAPMDMILDEFTMGDLIEFIDFLTSEFIEFENDSYDWNKILDYLREVKLVRNISAHGSSFLSAVLDKKNNPNYLIEGNSQTIGDDLFYIDNSKEYNIFNIVRSPIKLTSKGRIQSPQVFAIEVTKRLLNNQTYRSFVYFYYMVSYIFNSTEDYSVFRIELKKIFGKYPKKVNMNQVIENIQKNHTLGFEEKEKLLKVLIPQAKNMFSYVRTNCTEADYYSNKTYVITDDTDVTIIDLSENASWQYELLMNINMDEESQNEDKQSRAEVVSKFGIFFIENTGARKVLTNLLDDNLDEQPKKKMFAVLEKIEGYNTMKYLFLDVFELFSPSLN
ncbi:Abi family protein [Enterococcus avium]